MRVARNLKKVKGCLSFSTASGPGGSFFRLQLEDENSRLIMAEIDMSHEAFGRMLAHGIGEANCEVNFFLDNRFGLHMETKEEIVPVDWDSVYDREEESRRLQEAVIPFEKDGWIADSYINRRNYNNKNKTYRCVFRRWGRERRK